MLQCLAKSTANPPFVNRSKQPWNQRISTSRPLVNAAYIPSESSKEKEDSDAQTSTTKKLVNWGKDKIPILSSKRNKQGRNNIKQITTIEEYKQHVAEVQDKIVVVPFYASWCRSCKASAPLFYRMASTLSPEEVTFVEVPLLKENAYLHEGLGVPSVPFGHIYHPDVGLVEEMKVSKKEFRHFEEALNSYVRGSCDLYGNDTVQNDSVVYIDAGDDASIEHAL